MSAQRRPPRVALFTDSYDEANGIARLSRALEAQAQQRGLPFLCFHGGQETRVHFRGSVQHVELRRSAAAFRLEHDLEFDPLCWRHYRRARKIVSEFKPDVLHITGPSDVGQLGALIGHRLSIPIVGSWHTNLHQYAALRSSRWCRRLPSFVRPRVLTAIERAALDAAVQFYRIPRVVLAPNPDLVSMLAERTGRVTRLMKHGVDTQAFVPGPRPDRSAPVRIGFIGRLSPEKCVRLLAALHAALIARGVRCKFVFVGDGTERQWLEQVMPDAQFLGVLEGAALAQAFASLDLFAFPSPSETFGLAVLEAMASGVAVLAVARGGPAFFVEHGVSGWLVRNDQEFVEAGVNLAQDCELRDRLASGAVARAKEWSWEAVCDELYGVYTDMGWMPDVGPAVPDDSEGHAPAPSRP
jgi:glycosyltransferase involved in cell wall biosynthesis